MNARRGSGRGVALPVSFFVLCAAAGLFLGAGVVALVSPELVPPLASKTVAWSLIGVGGVLDAAAVIQLLATVREAKPR